MTSCGGPASAWHFDAISTGDRQFDSSKLTYVVSSSQLYLELLRTEAGVAGFLSLQHHRFRKGPETELSLTIEGQTTNFTLPVRVGRMRLALSSEVCQTLISALQRGSEVGMMTDGFELTVSPAQFQQKYGQLVDGELDLLNLVTESIR